MVTAQGVKMTALTAPTVAFIITALRIFERARTRKFGADDVFALLSAVLLLIFVIMMFIHLDHPELSRNTRVGIYYAGTEIFYAVLWTARLSILFSIMRITPGVAMRRMLYVLAATFFVWYAVLFAQNIWTCEAHTAWKDSPSPQCDLEDQVAVCQLIADVFADVFLVAFPLRLVRQITSLSKGHRLRLYLIFSTSIITTIVSVVHMYYILRVGGLLELVVALIENAISLIVCNLAVIITTAMRLLGLGGEDDSPSGQETYIVFEKQRRMTTTSTTLNSIELRTRDVITVGMEQIQDSDPSIIDIGKTVQLAKQPDMEAATHEKGVHFASLLEADSR